MGPGECLFLASSLALCAHKADSGQGTDGPGTVTEK